MIEDRAAYQRDWERNNVDKRRIINLRRRQKIRDWLESIKDDLSCERCDEDENICLDFHHVNLSDKVNAVSTMAMCGTAKNKILAEIAKCIVLCSNCHRKIHREMDQ